MQQTGIVVVNAEADANVQVSQTAIDSAASNETVLVGDDTDLLILLCYLIQRAQTVNCISDRNQSQTLNEQHGAGTLSRCKVVLGDPRSVTIFYSRMHCWDVIPLLECLVLVNPWF